MLPQPQNITYIILLLRLVVLCYFGSGQRSSFLFLFLYIAVKPSPVQPVVPTGFGVVMLPVQDNSPAGEDIQVPFKSCYQAMN